MTDPPPTRRAAILSVSPGAAGFAPVGPAALASAVLGRAGSTGAALTAIVDDGSCSPETTTDSAGDAASAITASVVIGLG